MRLIEAIKRLFQQIAGNLGKVVEDLTETQIIADWDGTLRFQESLIERLADRASAVIIAVIAAVILASPLDSKAVNEAGDQLMRAAIRLWNGVT